MAAHLVAKAAGDRIDKTAQAVRICFLLALLIVFNIYPDKVGIYRTLGDASSLVPLLGPGFYAALPWLTAWWALGLAVASALLFFERWTAELRLVDWTVDLVGILVLGRLLFGAPLFLAMPDWPVPFWTWNTLARLLLALALLGQVVGVLRGLVCRFAIHLPADALPDAPRGPEW